MTIARFVRELIDETMELRVRYAATAVEAELCQIIDELTSIT